jgi:tetratricopeptide (TPR) repeat protein
MSSDTPDFRDAQEAFDSGDFETSLVICEGLFDEDEVKTPIEVLHLAAESLLSLQEPQEAGHLVRIALEQGKEEPALHHCLGVSCFELADFIAARRHFERAVSLDHDLGEPLFYLAMIAEREGHAEKALELYSEAVKRDPENLISPTSWSTETITQVFDEVVEEMPDPFGIWLAGLAIRIEEFPLDSALQSEAGVISPLVHCLFEGGSKQQPEGDNPELWLTNHPDNVIVFRSNLGKSAHDQYELHRDLLEAILWESMDFLGFDDSHLFALGMLQEGDDESLHPGSANDH